MKKILVVIIASVLLLSVSCLPVLATTADSQASSIMSPMFTYIMSHTASMDIDDDGLASVTSIVNTYQDATIKITGTLQRYSGGTWTTVKSWTQTEYNTTFSSMDKTYYVTSGYNYRYKSATTVTVNGSNESSTVTTNSVYY